jgi:hypothetical protein
MGLSPMHACIAAYESFPDIPMHRSSLPVFTFCSLANESLKQFFKPVLFWGTLINAVAGADSSFHGHR